MSEPILQRCRVCGEVRALTAEHVIPRAAGHNCPTRLHTLQSVADGLTTGRRFQSGLCRKSICGRCNSTAGGYYVPAFVSWTQQAREYYERIPANVTIALPFAVQALAVAKQLAIMTLAMSELPSVDKAHFAHLRHLVVHPNMSGRTPGFRFYTYLHCGPPAMEGVHAGVSLAGGPIPVVFSHVGREPLGYVATADDSGSMAWAARLGLCDVTYFFEQPRNLIRTDHLQLRLLRGEIPFRPLGRG